jgi:membrane protease YdiL (CAAX protease family)
MDPISKRKKAHLILLVLVFACAAFMELGFRAYLYRALGHNSILAGSIPNFVAVVLISLIYTVIKNDSPIRTCTLACLIMVLYEFAQPIIQGRTFDLFDIAASLIGGIFVFCLLSIVDICLKPIANIN